MTIKAPAWCSDAVPTANGWEDPNTGEVYVSARFTQEQLDEYNDAQNPKPKRTRKAQVLREAPVNNAALEDMSEDDLDALSEQSGVEVEKPTRRGIKGLFG